MCLGIVGRVVSLSEETPELAQVDVAGIARPIHVGLLIEEGLEPGDWILIHAGFAMERIDADTARNQIAALRDYTGEPEDGGDLPREKGGR